MSLNCVIFWLQLRSDMHIVLEDGISRGYLVLMKKIIVEAKIDDVKYFIIILLYFTRK